jgi:DNA primase
MARRGLGGSDDRPKRAEDREQQLAALRVRLQETAGQVRTAEDWARGLQAAARLPEQSWANVLLISSRVPDAALVKGYEAWRSAGRQVSRGEKGIEIFATARRRAASRQDDEPEHSWRDADRVAYVWDLSQTGGQPLPVQTVTPVPAGEIPPGLWDCLCWLARREGFAVEREPGCPADGTTFWTARRIRVLPGPADGPAVWALAHQLGHVLLHHTTAVLQGTSTSGCQGVRKAEADAVAFITCVRHGIETGHTFASPQTWAGTDPRAQPGAAILAAGERITTAANRISRHLDHHLRGGAASQVATAAATVTATASASPSKADPKVQAILRDAEAFYVQQLASSWAPAYLRRRGITAEAIGEWRIGYAPRGWTTLLTHLRGRGHHDDEIQAAGLARASSRGTLIDHFRDRVMLPVHDEHGNLAGFIGRTHPDSRPGVPKYLNTPETSAYKKGSLLFGLYQAREHLAQEAVPVIVEGPFDAIAVTMAGQDRYAGLAPCGTALTTSQIEALSRIADLRKTSILVAFDDDNAGRKAAVRAYHLLRATSDRLQTVALPGKDPAAILESEGAAALPAVLRDRAGPLSALVIDAHLDPWERRLRDTDGPLLAMRSVAAVIADLLPAETAQAIQRITGNQELITVDEQMRPVANPALPQIASELPADAAFQITRTAERLGFTDYSDVLAEVANAVVRKTANSKGNSCQATPELVEANFPRPPPVAHVGSEPTAARTSRTSGHPKRPRLKRLPSS